MGPGLDDPPPLNARRQHAPPLPHLGLPALGSFPGNIKLPAQSHSLPGHHPQLPLPNSVTATTVDATTTAPGTKVVLSSPEPTSNWAGSYSANGRHPFTPTFGSSYSNRDPFASSISPSIHRNPGSTPGEAYDMNQQLPPFHQPTQPNHPVHPMIPQPVPSNDPNMPRSSAPSYGNAQTLTSPPAYHYPGHHFPGPSAPPPPLMHHAPRVPSNPPPHIPFQPRQYPSYSLPALPGAVMSNVHSPGGQMSLMNPLQNNMMHGFNSGHVASMQQMYGGHPPPMHGVAMGGAVGMGPTNDRPFKCDKCPQSFNRNHDLKRHSRIHLAVKPYPCPVCSKQFSRKDALKRHQLVKGCKDEIDKSVKEDGVKFDGPSGA